MLVSGVRNLFLNSVRMPLANQMKKEPVKLSENVDPSDPLSLPPTPPPATSQLFTGAGRRKGRFCHSWVHLGGSCAERFTNRKLLQGKANCFCFCFFSLFILKYSLHQSQREILNKPHCPQVCFLKEGIYSSPLPPMSVHSRIKARESGRGSLAEGKVCLCLFARH